MFAEEVLVESAERGVGPFVFCISTAIDMLLEKAHCDALMVRLTELTAVDRTWRTTAYTVEWKKGDILAGKIASRAAFPGIRTRHTGLFLPTARQYCDILSAKILKPS